MIHFLLPSYYTKNEIQNEIIEESEEKIEENLEIQKNTEVVSKISRDIAKIKLIKSEANNILSSKTSRHNLFIIIVELVDPKNIVLVIIFLYLSSKA